MWCPESHNDTSLSTASDGIGLEKINYPGTGNDSKFFYDGMGQNVQIEEDKAGVAVSTKQFICSANIRYEQIGGSGSETQYFRFGEVKNGSKYFFTQDHLRSIRDVTDSSVNLQSQLSYDPYGNSTQIQGGFQPDFQYADYYHHEASMLNLTPNRVYGPWFSRWLSRDPIGENQGANLYAYVDNQPNNLRDPSGLGPCELWCAAAALGVFTSCMLATQGDVHLCEESRKIALDVCVETTCNNKSKCKYFFQAGASKKPSRHNWNLFTPIPIVPGYPIYLPGVDTPVGPVPILPVPLIPIGPVLAPVPALE